MYSLLLLIDAHKGMNSTTFIPGNVGSESGMERVVWIVKEADACSNLFARVRYAPLPPALLISTQYQCFENVLFYRGNPAKDSGLLGVNVRHRFVC